jgi:hypothetical protein
VGRTALTSEPTVYWNPGGDLYATFYLFKFLRSAIIAKHQSEGLASNASLPVANHSQQQSEPDGPEVSDLELVDTDVVLNHLFFRYPTFATILIRPDLKGVWVSRTAYWQGPSLELLGLLAFAEESFEQAALKLPARNQTQEDTFFAKDQASPALAYSFSETELKMRAAGMPVQVFGFAHYVAAQAYKAYADRLVGKPQQPGGFDFDG